MDCEKKLQIMINLIVFIIQVKNMILVASARSVLSKERCFYLMFPVNIGLWSGVASQMMTRHR